MPRTKYTVEKLREAVAAARSYRDAVIRLGAHPHGGTIQGITARIHREGIDTSHFLGRHWSAGAASKRKRTAEEIFASTAEEQAHRLRRALLEVGVEYRCAECGIDEWRGKSIDLQVDHVDGNRKNSARENLRFICPNCHSQTDNFAFRGRRHKG